MRSRVDLRPDRKGCTLVVVGESAPTPKQKGITLATKKVTAKAEPMVGTFTMITKSPKVWGVRIYGQGKKGQSVEVVNRYGGRYTKRLVAKVADVPANEYTGQPAGEVWQFA